jgi:arginine utilization regulatory protein
MKFDGFELKYIDSLLIVDKHYNMLHTIRFNPRFDDGIIENVYSEYQNRNFFEIFPNLSKSESTIVECIRSRKIVVRKNQLNIDMKDNVFRTNNVTIPIVKKGEVVGAVELSQDITSIENASNSSLVNNRQDRQTIINDDLDEITFNDIITVNPSMQENIRKAKIYSHHENPVLIYGETGTGKELFVRAMVMNSRKDKSKFITQNCAAIPETLFESILFGTEKGAYTGAKDSKGLFHLADGGVLFLDEINSMPLSLQAKLLRVLQDKRIRPVGSAKEERINVKVIAAMNIDPETAIKNNKLREDLFYRFSSATIRLTPLRERIEDIPVYISRFIDQYNNVYRKSIRGVSKELLSFFMNYEWKGNVRELKHIIESTVSIVEEDIIRFNHLPIYMKNKISPSDDNNKNEYENLMSLNETLEKVEMDMIIKALAYTGGKMTETGRLLKIPRQTLKSKIDRLGIDIFKYKRQ